MQKRLFWISRHINIIIYVILGLVVAYLVASYFYFDTLGVYDAAGQLAAVEHAKSFWPLWQGWSSREMLGWSQGLTYPPAVHWIMAGLALIIGSVAAMKIVIVLALICLPIAIWWYLKQIDVSKEWRASLLILIIVVLMALPDYMGSNISSLFCLGLITNFVALPLLFLFFGLTERLVRKFSLKSLILAGLSLGILVWSHMVIAIVGLIYLGITAITALLMRKWRTFGYFVSVGFVGLAISLPFLIKFLLASGQMNSAGGIASLLTLNGLVFGASIVIFIYLWRKKDRTNLVPVIISGLLSFVGVLDSILVHKFGTSFILEWIHVYRLQTFAYVFITIAAVQMIIRFLGTRKFNYAALFSAVTVPILFVALIINNPATFEYAKIDVNSNNEINGRFLEDFSRADSYPAPYTFQTKLLAENSNSSWAYGLFTESAPNSSFVKSLSKSLNPKLYTSSLNTGKIDDVIIPESRVSTMLDLFAINSIISLNDNPIGAIGTWSRGSINQYYHQKKLSVKKLAEVPTISLRPVTNNWNKEVINWWSESGPVVDLPYDASTQPLPEYVNNSNVNVFVEIWTDKKIVLQIDSQNSVPVIIKTSYSKGWSATSADGANINIWRVAPQLMLISSAGQVELNYN